MPDPNPKAAAFYADAAAWREELAALRRLLLAAGLHEDFKWRSPVYTASGGNVATVWGFKDACALSFFKGVLLTDPTGFLTPPGPNSRAVRIAKFTDPAQITAAEPTLKTLIREAATLEAAGENVVFEDDNLPLPAELTERLSADPALKSAFEALTPGRRRGWVLHVSGAKQSATRAARTEKAAPRILAGKGMPDR